MSNLLLTISYDGTAYSGFQIQPNAPTVQQSIEQALEIIYKQPVRINGAGRTDAGVHARGQRASFTAPFPIAINKIPYALNSLLPEDIVIIDTREVPEDFHARFNASRKTYSYTLDRALFPQVMLRLYSWHLPDALDLNLMGETAKLLEGTHDFKAFQAVGSLVEDTFRTLYRVEINIIPEKDLLVIHYEGSGFLYRMARLITGTLVQVAQKRLPGSVVSEALLTGNPALIGPTAPARGLCLEWISYDGLVEEV
ncbi:MAG: tRNA pseudouridine(38-40) synthase TruA [Bacillota bacterium]|nr:tRNA pseudouridine(38-40) synthase TruA [Bacillota bacterium]